MLLEVPTSDMIMYRTIQRTTRERANHPILSSGMPRSRSVTGDRWDLMDLVLRMKCNRLDMPIELRAMVLRLGNGALAILVLPVLYYLPPASQEITMFDVPATQASGLVMVSDDDLAVSAESITMTMLEYVVIHKLRICIYHTLSNVDSNLARPVSLQIG